MQLIEAITLEKILASEYNRQHILYHYKIYDFKIFTRVKIIILG